jgi:hypothetical protein
VLTLVGRGAAHKLWVDQILRWQIQLVEMILDVLVAKSVRGVVVEERFKCHAGEGHGNHGRLPLLLPQSLYRLKRRCLFILADIGLSRHARLLAFVELALIDLSDPEVGPVRGNPMLRVGENAHRL